MKKIAEILKTSLQEVHKASDINSLDSVRVMYVGKKGKFTSSLRSLGSLSDKERPAAGEEINMAK
jgi:phenylalanyl-tRNA synthetase alpha chain